MIIAKLLRTISFFVLIGLSIKLFTDNFIKYGSTRFPGIVRNLTIFLRMLLILAKFYGLATFAFAMTFPYEPILFLVNLPEEFRHRGFILGQACLASGFILAVGGGLVSLLGMIIIFATILFGVLNEIR